MVEVEAVDITAWAVMLVDPEVVEAVVTDVPGEVAAALVIVQLQPQAKEILGDRQLVVVAVPGEQETLEQGALVALDLAQTALLEQLMQPAVEVAVAVAEH